MLPTTPTTKAVEDVGPDDRDVERAGRGSKESTTCRLIAGPRRDRSLAATVNSGDWLRSQAALG